MNSNQIPQIDNALYDQLATSWWSDKGVGAMLQHINNPWRLPYFQRVLTQQLGDFSGKRLLDVGCGGGMLAEKFAAMGFNVTGIDPSNNLLDAARHHAAEGGLNIDYYAGYGHELPFENGTFDIVACCDVLEHIQNWDAVISEIGRVLKPKGIFLYDTVNRTIISKIFFLKLSQEWKFTRFMPPNLHVWEMFIKPEELKESLERHGLQHKDTMGTKPVNPISFIIFAHQYSTGKMSTVEFGKRILPMEGPDTNALYMGYAVRP